jgi:hypothetical protein
MKSEQREAVGSACRTAKELNKTPFLARPVLIDKKAKDAIVFQVAEQMSHGAAF